ncbi:MAG: O-antigen ligase family protein [Kofleriaceae bacterium]
MATPDSGAMSAHASAIGNTSSRGAERVIVWFTILFVGIFYSNLPIYGGLFLWPVPQPLHWILIFVGCIALTWALTPWRSLPLPPPVVTWLAIYVSMCLIWTLFIGAGDPDVFAKRFLSLSLFLAALVLFCRSGDAVTAARRTILGLTILGVAINAYDISHPFFFVPAHSELALLGRASGLYANPNLSGAALVLGLILTIGIVPQRWRIPYLITVAAGVVTTLSRGAMVGYALSVLALYARGLISTRQMLAATFFGSITAWITWLFVVPALIGDLNLNLDVLLDRIMWILDPASGADFSQAERVVLAEKGWALFQSAPLLGNGVGSTELWAERTSTHNLYIMLMSDFGVLGILVFPALILATVAGRSTLADGLRPAFVIFMILWGTVSHNILTDHFMMIGIALMAAMCFPPRSTSTGRDDASAVAAPGSPP